MSWFLMALSKYATFSGRSQRSEFWFFLLSYVLLFVGLAIIDGMLGFFDEEEDIGLLSSLFAVAMFVPSLAVSVRRLHDTGRFGWWVLVAFVPVVGSIVMLLFAAEDSQPGANAYGPNPKGAA